MDSGFKTIMPTDSDYDEAVIIQAIRDRVSYLLETQPDLLMSYLYRLDVLEVDLKRVLNHSAQGDIINDFADLIWARQKQRIAYREQFKQAPIEGWEF